MLDEYFTAFDDIMAQHRLEKLKTIGDAYMALPACRRPIADIRRMRALRRWTCRRLWHA
jgi:class 3 adenylate cyclase